MPVSIAHFQLLERIGAGTLGELHRARDLDLGRSVALRLIAPSLRSHVDGLRAVLERAQRVSAVEHPAVTAVYECGEAGEFAYVASEYVPGQRLSALVGGSPLNPGRAVELAAQLADGLAVAQAHGLVHGALSTTAVIVTPRGGAKLLDVGMAEWTSAKATAPSDDLIGLGCVLFEMLVGRPLKRGWPAELRLKELPVELQPLLQALTSPGAGQASASMATAASALREHAARWRDGRSGR